MLKFVKENRRELLFWCVVILLAPVAIELIFIANMMGAEVAILFFAVFMKDRWILLLNRWDRLKEYVASTLAIISCHAVSNPRHFYLHAATSVALFAVTGSLSYATAIWYPVMLLGGDPGMPFI
ncbi:MAG: hypothetical protein ABJ308_13885 [Halieaceae bacterium]